MQCYSLLLSVLSPTIDCSLLPKTNKDSTRPDALSLGPIFTMTADSIKKLMLDRGYTLHSYTPDMEGMNFTKDMKGAFDVESAIIHAETSTQRQTIKLSFVDLRYGMSITTGYFAADHPDFRKYEEIIDHYAWVCQKHDPFKTGVVK